MENQKNNKRVIVFLIVIIVMLSVLCILFATGTISFKSNDVENNYSTDNVEYDAEEIARKQMPTVISLANQKNGVYTYCGERTNSDLTNNNYYYSLSTSYNSIAELRTYLNSIMSKSIFDKYFENAENKYIEQDNKLYCSYLPADGLSVYYMTESSINKLENLTYLISNKTNNSFDATLSFTYSSKIEEVVDQKNEFKASFIKENNTWKINSFEGK